MSKRKWEDFPTENLHKLYADGGISYKEYLEAIDLRKQQSTDWEHRHGQDWNMQQQPWNA